MRVVIGSGERRKSVTLDPKGTIGREKAADNLKSFLFRPGVLMTHLG